MSYRYTITTAIDYPQLPTPVLGGNHWTAHVKKSLECIELAIATSFGGFSKHKHTGSYIMKDDKKLVHENSITYEIITDSPKPNELTAITDQLKQELYQESILFTVTKLDQVKFV